MAPLSQFSPRECRWGAPQIALFESLKSLIVQSPDFNFDVNTLQAEAAFGAIGGWVGSVVTTPADVVTTTIMTRSEGDGASVDGAANGAADGALASPVDVALEIFAARGIGAFATGAGSRGLYWAPAIGIFLSLYCSLRQASLELLS